MMIPDAISCLVAYAHGSWQPVLLQGLKAIAESDPEYLVQLADSNYLPTDGRIFAAFCRPLEQVRYVLIGEGPYPRAASAIGLCFMDGAVGSLWSEKGLSKEVNRATSLRNFIKMLLVTGGYAKIEHLSGDALVNVARKAQKPESGWIRTRADLQNNLLDHEFLLLNATLVYRSDVPPIKEAKAWLPFMQTILAALARNAEEKHAVPPTLVLWGKIAGQIKLLPVSVPFPQVVSEHPYNLTFIANPVMQKLFGPMHLLCRKTKTN
jgi:uracil-DNA glycosylase